MEQDTMLKLVEIIHNNIIGGDLEVAESSCSLLLVGFKKAIPSIRTTNEEKDEYGED